MQQWDLGKSVAPTLSRNTKPHAKAMRYTKNLMCCIGFQVEEIHEIKLAGQQLRS
eukprot:m.10077 g.10077  ORF g.10077 m.10077 type:complete len:55 (-) comp8102_c0_seq2:325-489(-)